MAENDTMTAHRLQASRPVKRSFSLAGHRTSISLEAAFWDALRDAAKAEGVPLATLVVQIDAERGSAGLSGAVRVWVLDYFRRKAMSGAAAPAEADEVRSASAAVPPTADR